MNRLEAIITKEKSFLIAAGVTITARAFDMISSSVVISHKMNTTFDSCTAYVFIKEYGLYETAIHSILDKYAATFEANPLARRFIEEYGLNQGLFLHNLVVMVPTLAVAYFLNKMSRSPKIGDNILYIISGISVMVGINNLYQW